VRANDGVSFAALLRRHRLAAALSQEELSARSGLSVRAIGFMESGRTARPYRQSVDMLIAALDLAGLDAAALMLAAGRGSGWVDSPQPVAPYPADKAVDLDPWLPAELPSDIADFTGRPEQVGRLVSVLGGDAPDGAVPVSVITGCCGAGKSVLAVHVAHQLRRDFADGQLFLELRGSGSEPVTSATAGC